MTARPPASVPLHDGWTVEPIAGPAPESVRAAGPVPATVPGTVHTDLLANGLIDDPLVGVNEKAQGWIGSTSWRYASAFDWTDDGAEHVDLVLEGLDTVATVRLNGEVVLSSRNQHRSYRVPVAGLLREGSNRLEVVFAAPVPEADRASLELEYRPHVNDHPYNAVRKMACSFGWDWGPDTATSGIWRPVRLESWSTARIADLGVSAEVEGSTGVASLRLRTDGDTDGLRVRATIGEVVGEAAAADGGVDLRLEVPDAALWWPRGYGEQARHDLAVSLLDADGAELDRRTHTIGFRSVRVDTAPDAAGAPFTIVVNERPVLVKGVNWIPDDPFPHRVDAARYRRRLEQAADAHVNLVRVWGGGIYESEDFYDAADALGLLVWQDLLLACAAYAEEEPLASEIEAEAREAVLRLGRHPSLVVLNGNNENVWGHVEWGWERRLEGRTWGAGYYYDLFPRIVAELAPHVAYTPGSPFSPDPRLHPNDPSNGTVHLWEQWNALDWTTYRDVRPRFVAEFGWQGPPAWPTLTEALDDDPLTPESPGMLVHQKATEGNTKLTDGLVPHLALPNAMPDWHWAMSLNQAVAVRTAVEWFRSLQPHCTGTIVWQLNDCWPVVSWSAIDGAGRRKPLWYALQAAYRPRLVTVQPTGRGLEVVLANDADEPWEARLVQQRRGADGEVLAEASRSTTVPPRAVQRVAVDDAVGAVGDPAAELLVATAGEERGFWFFAEPRDSALPAARLEASAETTGDGVEVTIVARSVVRELALLADVAAPDAEADRMLLTMLPGERAVIRVRTTSGVDPERFLEPDVLRTALGTAVERPVAARA